MTILFITSRYPYPLLKGDQVRAYHQINELVKRGHQVMLISFDNGNRNLALERACQAVYLAKPVSKQRIVRHLLRQLFSNDPLQLAFFYSPEMKILLNQVLKKHSPEVAILQLSRMGDYLSTLLDAKVPVVLDLIDSLAMNIDLKSKKAAFPMNLLWKLESKRLFVYESKAVASVAAATVVSEKDKEYLQSDSVHVNPNGVLMSQGQPVEPRDQETILFHGNMSYYPNIEAAQFLVHEIMPEVWKQKPNCKVYIIGADPAKQILDLATKQVVVTGFVDDVNPFLHTATLGVYPILRATGIQNKILEAMVGGLPVITTSTVAEGIKEASSPEHFYKEDDALQIAKKILQLLDNPVERQRLSKSGRDLIAKAYTWEMQVSALEKLLGKEL
jgi:polysaccharide biosynthesis protein PslH